jgi:hypothetical protein
MSDRLLPGIAFLVAAAIVCGASFVIASKGGEMLGDKGAKVAPPTTTATPQLQAGASVARPEPVRTPSAAPDPYTEETGQAPRQGPVIYRCARDGSVVYSDRPCANGRALDLQPNSGFNPTQVPQHDGRQPVVTLEEAEGPTRAQSTTVATEDPGSGEPIRKARCATIEAEIARIDALARAGGPASYQDWLRDERRRLVDKRYALKC